MCLPFFSLRRLLLSLLSSASFSLALLRLFLSLRLRSSSEEELSENEVEGERSRLRLRLCDLEPRLGELFRLGVRRHRDNHDVITDLSRTGLLGDGGQIQNFLLSRCCCRLLGIYIKQL